MKPTVEQVARVRKAMGSVTVDALVTNAHADQMAEELAQALFEPETVSTAADLDALPVGSVVTVGHLAYIKRAMGVWVGARGLSVGNHTLASYRSAVVRFNPEED